MTEGIERQRSESSRSCFSQAKPGGVSAHVPSGNRSASPSSLSDCKLSGVRMSPCPRPIASSIGATRALRSEPAVLSLNPGTQRSQNVDQVSVDSPTDRRTPQASRPTAATASRSGVRSRDASMPTTSHAAGGVDPASRTAAFVRMRASRPVALARPAGTTSSRDIRRRVRSRSRSRSELSGRRFGALGIRPERASGRRWARRLLPEERGCGRCVDVDEWRGGSGWLSDVVRAGALVEPAVLVSESPLPRRGR